MSRILMRAGRSPFETAAPTDILQRGLIAGNTGNLLFSDAIWKFLSTPGNQITPNRYRARAEEADRINDEYDLFVIPLANALRPNFRGQLNQLSALVEKLDIPVVVFGVGTQAGMDGGTGHLAPIEADVRRFCSAVLDRSPSIGVRGEITEKYLKGLGFNDVEIIGCPSMFTHGRHLEVRKDPAGLSTTSRIAVNISYESGNIPGSDLDSESLNRLMDAALDRYPDLVYLGQERRDLELLHWGDLSVENQERSPAPLVRSHRLLTEDRTRLYLDTPRWIEALRDRDFAFGTRIHGNVAALLAGTPAVVLCHDSRTLELCRYFDIPHRLVSDLPSDGDLSLLPERLYEEADFTAMHTGHGERFDRLVSFMDRHGLEHVHGPDGDGGTAFEKELKGVRHHPGVTAWRGGDDGDLGYRLVWLRQENARVKSRLSDTEKKARDLHKAAELHSKRNAELTAALKKADKRLANLEKQVRSTPYMRLRRLAGKILRRLGLRR
ncbi:polysaccharide pyruvyl transferase family protein [Nocardiopsis metallicus]|uniref:Polysaccharide pyruvyl transferase domain-containing protein n=1 Tax=Nocardiopsis metallicus TaxID=179819 RepID=A0A840WFZ5_9ACTN|nr:polysaccharide pyruvyl transferase family protein [Nocardiopsis metallicus]MBB5495014.1 hypothetical protein [Nocardiopsis metallicus]